LQELRLHLQLQLRIHTTVTWSAYGPVFESLPSGQQLLAVAAAAVIHLLHRTPILRMTSCQQ
jgi:hypothetical protein